MTKPTTPKCCNNPCIVKYPYRNEGADILFPSHWADDWNRGCLNCGAHWNENKPCTPIKKGEEDDL